ncbi:MAG: MBL fold metallo-hydrolase [Nitrospirae bacterium]|nr:MBL fold metallo-hydrolase [Nitrospirota bacterium]
MRIGEFEVVIITDGYERLDGGAMFGVVPKVLWEKTNPPDDRNRILMGLNCLLVQGNGKRILIDTGVGRKNDPKFCDIYGIEGRSSLLDSLKGYGLKPGDIDIVINTHLHFDHAGGNTFYDEKGRVAPTFPHARYFTQKGEWDVALNPNERTRATYLKENFLPLEENNCLELIDGDVEIIKGVSLIKTPGHTLHHQSVLIGSGREKGLFIGDLIPMAPHLHLPYIMAYDLYPLTTLETKRWLLARAMDEDWIIFLDHDPTMKAGRVRSANNRYMVEEIKYA